MDPFDANTYNSRGNVRADRGDARQALADYSRSIELDGSEAIVYVNRATAFNELGDLESALLDLEVAQSLTDDPGVLAIIEEMLASITPST